MGGKQPVAEQPFNADDARPVATWAEASRRLGEAGMYWLATARPEGRPHVVPVLAVWVDSALHFAASPASRKALNLVRDRHCVVTADGGTLHLVVEGAASTVRDEGRLHRVAGAYAAKYEWRVTVRDGALYGDGAPTAGPPPYEVYELEPAVAFGFGTEESLGATRWRF